MVVYVLMVIAALLAYMTFRDTPEKKREREAKFWEDWHDRS
jgi:hypothetical protein